MRAYFAFAVPTLLVAAIACSSNDSGRAGDASADSSPADAGDEDCIFCGIAEDVGLPQGDDGGSTTDGTVSSCGALEAQLGDLQAAAQACNANLTMQCNGETMGPCCPITVTASNTEAVNNFDQAVASYVAACSPSCSSFCPMPAPPSNRCISGGAGSVCQ